MKNNHKYFLNIQRNEELNSQKLTFKINNDPKEICKLLVGQYNSQSNKSDNEPKVIKEIFSNIQH